jgi:hypothetical protein
VIELKIPLGSYHIIDGEKVSVMYSGQEWTCASCHQLKSICPGVAVARDCTADRVLLSSYMAEHWQKIGYKPDTDKLNEVDGALNLEIQVGRKEKENLVIPESTLTSKYRSVIVKGFKSDTAIADIKEVLSQNGLPAEHKEEDIIRNEKTGSLTVINLKPEECLSLKKMNRKTFLNRQVFVTSVVVDSPVKAPPVSTNSSTSDKTPPTINIESLNTTPANLGLIDPATGAINKVYLATSNSDKPPTPGPTPINSSTDQLDGFVFGLVSPGVKEKISQIEGLKR